jgi:hypothetical protein
MPPGDDCIKSLLPHATAALVVLPIPSTSALLSFILTAYAGNAAGMCSTSHTSA